MIDTVFMTRLYRPWFATDAQCPAPIAYAITGSLNHFPPGATKPSIALCTCVS